MDVLVGGRNRSDAAGADSSIASCGRARARIWVTRCENSFRRQKLGAIQAAIAAALSPRETVAAIRKKKKKKFRQVLTAANFPQTKTPEKQKRRQAPA